MKTQKPRIECQYQAAARTTYSYEERLDFSNSFDGSRRPIGFRLKGEIKDVGVKTLKLYENECKKVVVLDKIYLFSRPLQAIIDEINYSLYLLDLKEDWNNDGGLPLDQDLYVDTIDFLHKYSEFVFKSYGIIIQSPEINLCPNGSLDLSWTTVNTRLLINFKRSNGSNLVTFYGYTKGSNGEKTVKIPKEGVIDLDNFDELLAVWMKQLT